MSDRDSARVSVATVIVVAAIVAVLAGVWDDVLGGIIVVLLFRIINIYSSDG